LARTLRLYPQAEDGKVSAPFKPGDVVEVVDARPAAWHEPKGISLQLGDVFTVLSFQRAIPLGWAFPRSFVEIAATKGNVAHWDAYRFRKITDRTDAAMIERIKRAAKSRERVQ
jgi:hypothetical protein